MNSKVLCALFFAVLAVGCVRRMQRSVVTPDAIATVDHRAPFLKVHARDGSLVVLSPWQADEAAQVVSGTGTRYALDRSVLGEGPISVPFDSVVLFETNVVRPSPSVAGLGVITGITAGLAVVCAASPKTCFGSCPTFYVTDGSRDVLQAEGFSASIAPALEARDVDMLFRARPTGREVRVAMVNEALETHVVRYANLLAVPRTPGRRVLTDDSGGFWSVTDPLPAMGCSAPEGDCAAVLSSFDEHERSSEADSLDLAAREFLDLVFPATERPSALVLASRQSLLPTYLLYQALAWLGTSVGTWMAALERMGVGTKDGGGGVVAALGGIDVLVANGPGAWDSIATIRETGPLASDVRLVRLPATKGPIRVRLRMAKGAWRIDYAGLALLEQSVSPTRIEPAEVLHMDGRVAKDARARLTTPDEALITFPGDRYTLVYRLPEPASSYELFLETKGYYLEWMRSEWLAEEDPLRAAAFFLDPAGSLRRLAPDFKRVETKLEAAFWSSKYVEGHR
jgi:hypothetical protein